MNAGLNISASLDVARAVGKNMSGVCLARVRTSPELPNVCVRGMLLGPSIRIQICLVISSCAV